MVHMGENTTVCLYHQGQFHGKGVPGKNMLRLRRGRITLSCKSAWILRKTGGESPTHIHHPLLDVFFKRYHHSQHERTWFSSEIFRNFHLFSAVHVHECSTKFCRIQCDVPFPFLLNPYYVIMVEMIKV